MTKKRETTDPMPAGGGSYTRKPDGSLNRVEGPVPDGEAPPAGAMTPDPTPQKEA